MLLVRLDLHKFLEIVSRCLIMNWLTCACLFSFPMIIDAYLPRLPATSNLTRQLNLMEKCIYNEIYAPWWDVSEDDKALYLFRDMSQNAEKRVDQLPYGIYRSLSHFTNSKIRNIFLLALHIRKPLQFSD